MKKDDSQFRSLDTRAIHAGEGRFKYADSLTTPIVQTSTFTFRDSNDIREYTREKKERYEYGRYGNPTEKIAEKRLADMEGSEDCLIFSSGMMAIQLLSFHSYVPVIISS